MGFNKWDIEEEYYRTDPGPYGSGMFADKEAVQLYKITENLEEYYQQKAPNLWNAWVRAHNMLVEQQEKINELNRRLDKQGLKLNTLMNNTKYIESIHQKMERIEKFLSKTQEQQKTNTQNLSR